MRRRARTADLRDLIQRAALTNRHYGYRPALPRASAPAELIVNAKRVLRLSTEDNLLALRAKPSFRTTMVATGHPIPAEPCAPAEADRPRPDLGRRHHLCPARGGLRLSRGRHRRSRASGALRARQLDIWRRSRCKRSASFARPLKSCTPDKAPFKFNARCKTPARTLCPGEVCEGVAIGMSRQNRYDNAKAESFMKTLKTHGGERNGLRRPRGRPPPDRPVHRSSLQSPAPALVARLSSSKPNCVRS